MAHVDMTRPEEGRDYSPGTDLWTIKECVEDTSRNDDPMLRLKLARVSSPGTHVFDTIMLAGGGWGIGKTKLRALGVGADFQGELDPISFVGKRLWAAMVENEYTDKTGKKRVGLKVNINELKYNGLQPEDMVPPGCEAPEPDVDDPTPF